ncbi:alkane hydroxylase MAH1-like protein [Tanacetum coccineum]|uniref:Alkane hydroxylase MAH1-like protein n=1 Tax=Tanacetum coccineum TaxID=301880 RepID=A0ABQ5G680_9ASTR
MFPTVLYYLYVYPPHDVITYALKRSDGTFFFKGPWLADLDILVTANPLDIHHIMSKNFNNYPRGEKFRSIFNILGDGFSSSDGELWASQRRTIMSLLKLPSFQSLFERTIWNKVENGLWPLLECLSKSGANLDLQDIFQRFAFDMICTLLFDHDPKSMSTECPNIPCEKALSEAEEAIFHRHIRPQIFWKVQRLLNIGNEKKLSNAWETIDQFIYTSLSQKQNELTNEKCEPLEEKFNYCATIIKEFKDQSGASGDATKFLRDNVLNLMVAGRDSTSSTLSWLFYLLSQYPKVEDKIREELDAKLLKKKGREWKDFITKELHNLVYLHGALCEVLRLFPPISFQHKSPIQSDVLPSGHRVNKNTTIILSYYSMGRMISIWGEDCNKFKPERWVSVGGDIKHQPSYKFPAFNVGPRACLGKDMSFSHMKMVAATIIYHYHVELLKGHSVFPSRSILLKMKHGLNVRLIKRSK